MCAPAHEYRFCLRPPAPENHGAVDDAHDIPVSAREVDAIGARVQGPVLAARVGNRRDDRLRARVRGERACDAGEKRTPSHGVV